MEEKYRFILKNSIKKEKILLSLLLFIEISLSVISVKLCFFDNPIFDAACCAVKVDAYLGDRFATEGKALVVVL